MEISGECISRKSNIDQRGDQRLIRTTYPPHPLLLIAPPCLSGA